MKNLLKLLVLGLFVFVLGCDPVDDDYEADWEYTYLVTCSDSLESCKVDLRIVTKDGRVFKNSVGLPWSMKFFVCDNNEEVITPELEVYTDGGDYGIKAVITTARIEEEYTFLARFPTKVSYKGLSALQAYEKFCYLTNSLGNSILGLENDEKEELNAIVDAFFEAEYNFADTMQTGNDYLKVW